MGLEGPEFRAWYEEQKAREREERAAERKANKEKLESELRAKMEQLEVERRALERRLEVAMEEKTHLESQSYGQVVDGCSDSSFSMEWQLASVTDAYALDGQQSGVVTMRAVVVTLPEAHFEAYGEVHDGLERRISFVQRVDWYANQTGCLPPSLWQKLCYCAST
ncbi:hypothetical protein HPB52_013723 [Rhipicephalus sanguineus]|uniref:Uncharacterized protein n=1 Tax=Rhipicephalus sanguineus TaxID=34632 RepID=A0A9D4SQZ3_RHISA|nr:hypothetical protein HPB52_013723 [Rhipicephalus sanguineus]